MVSWVEKMLRIVSFVRFFGRIEEVINCFQDLLTFSYWFWQFAGRLWLFSVNSFKIVPIIKSKQIWRHVKGSILYLLHCNLWVPKDSLHSKLLAISNRKKFNCQDQFFRNGSQNTYHQDKWTKTLLNKKIVGKLTLWSWARKKARVR